MKYSFIELGGAKRPMAFSKMATARFLEETGMTLQEMNTTFAKNPNEYTGADLMNIFLLLFHSLKDGLRIARKEGEEIPESLNDFTVEDVADWTDESETKLAEVFDAFVQAQTPPPDKKKKARKAAAKS